MCCVLCLIMIILFCKLLYTVKFISCSLACVYSDLFDQDGMKVYQFVLGIGYYTAVDLARRNARIILACRNTETATAAAAQIRMQTGNENVVVRELNLSQLKSVRKFASVILEEENRLDILVNNAGTTGLHYFLRMKRLL